MFRRKKKSDNQEVSPSLLLATKDETLLSEFHPEVVNSIRSMTTRLVYKNSLPPTISLVSSLRQEGVSYISRAFATVLANDLNVSVCVVELNWWWPDSISSILQEQSDGLAAVLLNRDMSLKNVIVQTNRPNLAILPSGKMPLNERPVWARSSQLQAVIQELNKQYDHLILDIPAILAINDSIPLASLADNCCLVINQGVTPLESTRQAVAEINHLPIAGAVMNKIHIHTPNWILKYIPQEMPETQAN